MDKVWSIMLETAKSKISDKAINCFISAGDVAACLESDSGRLYKGINIDASCGIGMCAERNAISHMLTHGENKLKRVVCVDRNGNLMPPCGVCREAIMQLDPIFNANCEILLSVSPFKTMKLKELLPEWWGLEYHKNNN